MAQQIDPMWDDKPIDVSSEVNFIWSIANKLRGPYQSDKYKDVIIPMTILRRFECALAPTKQAVLEQYKKNQLPGEGHAVSRSILCVPHVEVLREKMLLKQKAGLRPPERVSHQTPSDILLFIQKAILCCPRFRTKIYVCSNGIKAAHEMER